MSQKHDLLSYLQEGHSITSLDAIRHMGITRISAIIHKLKADGHNIVRSDVAVVDRQGKKKTIGKWWLHGQEPNLDYVQQIEMQV